MNCLTIKQFQAEFRLAGVNEFTHWKLKFNSVAANINKLIQLDNDISLNYSILRGLNE